MAVLGPETAVSRFMYATALPTSSGRWSSTHSVDPISPNSSASHDPKMMVRRGFHPWSMSLPNALAISTSMEPPEMASAAPPVVQPSLWFPMMTNSSSEVPLMYPMTSQAGSSRRSIKCTMSRVAPGAGPLL